MFTLQFSNQSVKDLKKLSQNIQKRIILKLKFYISQPYPCTFAKKLTNSDIGQYRFRVGDYRIVFDMEEENILFILRIGHRRHIYKS